MTLTATGPIAEVIARWVVRLEAAGSLLRMMFLGVTAASTLTSALALIGLEQYAPYVLVTGIAATLAFAFGYVEYGIFNRKNREKNDRGTNFAGPTIRIDDELIARAILAAEKGRELTDKEREPIKTEMNHGWAEHRNGIPLNNDT